MGSSPSSDKPSWPTLVLKRADQVVAASLLAVFLTCLAGHWIHQHWRQGELIEIERAAPVQVAFQIDINQADWPEFSLLPGIGETLAKRIVEHRREQGPFADLESLRDVRGIGPKTFEGIEPYLLPLADVEATAESPPTATARNADG